MFNTQVMPTATEQAWEHRYEDLHSARITSDEDFHSWLLKWAALEAEIYERGTALTRDFQADTSNEAAKKARRDFLTQRAPQLKERGLT